MPKITKTVYTGPKFTSTVDNKPTQVVKKRTATTPKRFNKTEYSTVKPLDIKSKAKSMVRKATKRKSK